MHHIEGTFKGLNGLTLYYQSWHSDDPVQAVIVMVHGLGGHSSLFESAVNYLVPRGYEVFTFDLRGHGRSPGQRGFINAWSEFREDLRLFFEHIAQIRVECPCPRFLWGHSLGGTIALDYALHYPDRLNGLILTAPALERVGVSPIKIALGRMMSGVFPRFSLKLGLRKDLCSRDRDVCMAFLADPLRHEYGSARLATEFFATVEWISTHISELQVPLLLLHCSSDEVTFSDASRNFFQRIEFPDKEHYEYAECYHDLFMDVEVQALSDLQGWLERHSVGRDSCQPLLHLMASPITTVSPTLTDSVGTPS